MLILDLAHRENEFRKIIDLVKIKNQSDELKLLGLIYHKYADVASNYDYVWSKLRDQNIALFIYDVKRLDFNDLVSIPHYSEFRLGDVYCLENPRGFVNKDKPIKLKVRFFNRARLTVEPIVESLPSIEQLTNDLEIRSEKDLQFIENLIEDHSDEDKLVRLSYLSKAHEIAASNKELEASRKYIETNDAKTYIEEKNRC